MDFLKKNWRFFTVLLLVALFAFFVYPGRYQYVADSRYLDDIARPTRVDRLTGHVQVFVIGNKVGAWLDIQDWKTK